VLNSGGAGTGPGTAQFGVAATAGGSRAGSVKVAGQNVAVSQGAGCGYSISPESSTVTAAGGSGRVSVTADAGCAWTATSNASWIQLAGPTSGAGNGEVSYLAGAISSAGRTGTISVAGRTFTLTQSAGCSFALSAASHSVPAEGGTGSVSLSAGDGCGWTAASNASWLSITSTSSGTGASAVAFAAAPNQGAARSGQLTIGGQTFTVNQAGACTYAIAPDQQSVNAAGTSLSVAVTSPAGCPWTVTSQAGWITVQAPGSASGNGAAQVIVAANNGSARSGTATIAGRTLTINQAAAETACSYSVDRTSVNVQGWYRETELDVTAPQGCAWTARSHVTWITVQSGASGSGNGEVEIRISVNWTGAERTGTLTIAGITVTVKQRALDDD
jgi:hypothetical protein